MRRELLVFFFERRDLLVCLVAYNLVYCNLIGRLDSQRMFLNLSCDFVTLSKMQLIHEMGPIFNLLCLQVPNIRTTTFFQYQQHKPESRYFFPSSTSPNYQMHPKVHFVLIDNAFRKQSISGVICGVCLLVVCYFLVSYTRVK